MRRDEEVLARARFSGHGRDNEEAVRITEVGA
jgi:hypothetical protein